MKKKFENVEAALAYQRELSDKLGVVENDLLNRELTDEERAAKTAERESLEVEYHAVERESKMLLNEKQNRSLTSAPKVDVNTQLREFIKTAKKGDSFMLPLNREAMSTADTTPYVQGITVVDLIDTERKDDDILLTAGVPMTTGVVGNKIQWAFAGGVEAVFANELAKTTERKISLDKQTPIQNRLTLRVRVSNQVLENSAFDLQGYIVTHVANALRDKINWAAASTTKATETLYGGFAQNAEQGTYGTAGYVPGKQTGTYTTLTKEVAAEMIGKLASRNIKLDNVVFVMGAADFWLAKVTPLDAGSGIMLIGNDNRLLGIPVIANNAINRATQKGALEGHNIGLGNFKYLPTMQHGNIRLSIDATSALAADTDEVIVTINADFSMTVLKDGADGFVVYSKTGSSSNEIGD
jgi:HK97 family phage major capsid protein